MIAKSQNLGIKRGGVIPIYRYCCDECSGSMELTVSVERRNEGEGPCLYCETGTMKKVIGNNGGFRLLDNGRVSWGDGGYSTIHGDIENFKAGRKVYE